MMSEKDSAVELTRLWPVSAREALYPLEAGALYDDFEREQDRLFVGDDENDITVIDIPLEGK